MSDRISIILKAEQHNFEGEMTAKSDVIITTTETAMHITVDQIESPIKEVKGEKLIEMLEAMIQTIKGYEAPKTV